MNGDRQPLDEPTLELNSLLVAVGLEPLELSQLAKFEAYLGLILRWSARMNLTAVRDAAGIMQRHFVESIACSRFLPAGLGSLLDFGSGAGFPGLPIAICRPELSVVLAESQARKAAFLQEAVRTVGLKCQVWARRAEDWDGRFDCAVLRAVDRMETAVASAGQLVRSGGWLAVLTTEADLPQLKLAAGEEFEWSQAPHLPGSEQRILGLGLKTSSAG